MPVTVPDLNKNHGRGGGVRATKKKPGYATVMHYVTFDLVGESGINVWYGVVMMIGVVCW